MSTADIARQAVFVDRDGTINRKAPEGDYVKSVEEFEFLPGAREALRTLTERGIGIVIVTNQRGIALGRMTEDDLAAIHAHMLEELDADGARIDAIYYCPHDRGQCSCRKPDVGMFVRAQREHPELRLADSIVIGDSEADMTAAARFGLRGVQVAPDDQQARSVPVAYRASSLLDAARWVTELTADLARP